MVELFYSILRAIGYAHPVHVLVTHMPIGLLTGALVFGLIALFVAKESLTRSARHAFVLALVFAVPTIIFGVMDWVHFYKSAWVPAIRMKIVLAAILLVLLAAGFVLGKPGRSNRIVMLVIYGLAFLTVVGLGYYGGNLVFGESVAASAPAPSAAPPQVSASPADLQAGQAVFVANCQACHPKGGNVVEPKILLRASAKLASPGGFVSFIRDPKRPDGKEGEMPSFAAAQIDDGKAGQLYLYIVDTVRKGSWR